ncbi:Two-component system, sensor protein [Pseudomonas batumici]|uniref:histidine kinase n=1 Tax=Pseudomonas batumici TaxID=226910 RepID=A0A0C2EW85_9PSED|nr:Two-component system, sensor protein [Pseudomonas batumici]
MVAQQSSRLTEQLLDLARLTAGGRAPNHGLADLSELVLHVAHEFDIYATQQERTLSLAISPCMVRCDINEIGILLRNLVDNGLRYTDKGGHVHVSCGYRAGTDRRVYLEVADNGPGVPIEERALIFERFYRKAGVQKNGAAELDCPWSQALPGITALPLKLNKDSMGADCRYASHLRLSATKPVCLPGSDHRPDRPSTRLESSQLRGHFGIQNQTAIETTIQASYERFCLFHVFLHEPSHFVRIAISRGIQNGCVATDVRAPETHMFICRRVGAVDHKTAQQLIDQLAKKSKERIAIRFGEQIVKIQIGLALIKQCSVAATGGLAGLYIRLQSRQLLVGQIGNCACCQLGLQNGSGCIEIFHADVLEKQIVLHQLQGPFQRNLANGSSAGRAGTDRNQSLNL